MNRRLSGGQLAADESRPAYVVDGAYALCVEKVLCGTRPFIRFRKLQFVFRNERGKTGPAE